MGVEGALRVGIDVRDGRIAQLRVASTRPDVARDLLQGRSRAEVAAAVPLLFSICGRSQAAASALACEAAAGEEATPDTLMRRCAEVSAETVRECAWRVLLDWPKAIGERPTEEAVAAARDSFDLRFGEPAEPGAAAIAQAAFGSSAEEWLSLRSLPALDRWIDAGATAAARFLRQVRDDDDAAAGGVEGRAPGARLLNGRPDASLFAEFSAAIDADAGFFRRPTWHGAAAETGALARLQAEPPLDEMLCRSASRVAARFVARLRELALLLAGSGAAAVGAQALERGCGIGWVESARGLLLHGVRLAQGRLASYRIVAPTEWNFHPEGSLALALAGTVVDDRKAVTRRAQRLVQSLDPCVECQVEFDDA